MKKHEKPFAIGGPREIHIRDIRRSRRKHKALERELAAEDLTSGLKNISRQFPALSKIQRLNLLGKQFFKS